MCYLQSRIYSSYYPVQKLKVNMYDKCVKSIILLLLFRISRGELSTKYGLKRKFSVINKLKFKTANLFIILFSKLGKGIDIYFFYLSCL